MATKTLVTESPNFGQNSKLGHATNHFKSLLRAQYTPEMSLNYITRNINNQYFDQYCQSIANSVKVKTSQVLGKYQINSVIQ